jgi:hypothetical protein
MIDANRKKPVVFSSDSWLDVRVINVSIVDVFSVVEV